MKRITKILCIFVLTIIAFVIAGCGSDVLHTHSFSKWTIDVEPTLHSTGYAYRNCTCGNVQEKNLEPLSDTRVWTKVDEKAATCTAVGTETYESEYGQVVIVVAEIVPHPVGEWFISVEPTLDTKGIYRLECSTCDYAEEQEIPALTDQTVWTVIETVNAECDVEGYEVYESTYGQVKYSYGYLEHNYGAWVIVEEPDYNNGGKAEKTCPDCQHVAELELPNLTDATYWTEGQTVDATYNEDGYIPFTSDDLTFNYVLNKLVAPYDGKTYSSFAFDADNDGVQVNGVIKPTTVWSTATVTLDNNGKGDGTAYPFRGLNEFVMVDPATGKMIVKQTSYETDDETEETYLDTTSTITYNAYVDFETGIVVRSAHSTFDYLHVFTPFEVEVDADRTVASSWDNAIAIDYSYNNDKYTIFAYNNVVYFGVKFVDETGHVISADQCVSSNYVYVMNKNNELLAQFVNNGEKLVVADGYQGTYVNGNDTLIVSGCGTLTLNDTVGTYTITTEEDNYTIEAYINNEFLEITLAQDTYTSNKPMVTVSFDAGTYATVADAVLNKNIVAQLPVPTTETQTFKGWFYDAELKNPVEAEFKPTTDCTLYAAWKPKVVINLVGALASDPNTLYLGEGDTIGQYLPTYNLDLDNFKVFKGWFLDQDFNNALPEEAEVTVDDTNISIYAKWEDLPAYYGTYYGSEIWNAGYGNNGGKTLTIDENGNISGFKTGVIVSYDETTQKVTWKPNNSNNTYTFYLNEDLGVIAGIYNNNNIGNDYYFLSKYLGNSNGKVEATYGVKAPEKPGMTTISSWYAQFVKTTCENGSENVFLYNNYIYNNITITDSLGNPLEVAEIKDSKTVVVKDQDGKIIIALASLGTSFANKSDTVVLDSYFGTYTDGNQTIVLDGTGNIEFGGKSGTYTEALEGSNYTLDVYLENNTEYYTITLNGTNYSMLMPMVPVNVVVPEGHAEISSFFANVNVLTTLPNAEEQGYVFNGYYLEPTFETKVSDPYTFTKATTLYAKYSLPAVLTVVYNNGGENDTIVYSVNDVVTIDNPVMKKYAFVGWFTTDEFEAGTEWVSGTTITTDTTIYAKWEVAPAYYNDYTVTRIWGTKAEGGTDYNTYTYTYTASYSNPDQHVISFNAQGVGTSIASPFGTNDLGIKNYNETTGYLEIVVGTSTYQGYLDKASGIIITSHSSGKDLQQVYFLNPFEYVAIDNNISESYWCEGYARAIQYTYDQATYSIFVYNNNVYFDVTFEDANGNAVEAKNCYKNSTVYVYDANDTLIAKFGYDGTKLQELDGLEGSYTNANDVLVLSGYGALTLNNVAGTYTIALDSTSYDLDVYVNGEYLEVTLGEGTYTTNKPMVTVTFNTADKAVVDAVTTNKNIAINLPTPQNENFVFRGWYTDAAFETLVEGSYTPTADAILYAKWDVKVTLTVVYGNTLNDATIEYGAGDTTAPNEPLFTNGKVFAGWYLDETLETPYEIGTITADTTIYCKWIDAVAMYGSYTGFNLYGGSKSSVYMNAYFEVAADGTTSGKKTGTVTNYNPETGVFYIENGSSTYYAHYEEQSGAIIFAYGSNATGVGTDLFLMFKKTPVSGVQSGNIESGNGYTKLITITFDDNTTESFLVMGDKVYGGVAWNVDKTAYNITDASSYTIYDRDGNVLYSK